jgi:hypothetical protein
MGICALIEAVILGVVWFVEPPSYPASAVSQFTCTFLFGMGVVACTGVKGFWKRLLLLAPAHVLVTATEGIRSWLGDPSSRSVWVYLFGSVYGGVQMAFGFKPKPKRIKRKR